MTDFAFRQWSLPVHLRAVDWMFASHFSQIQSGRIKDLLLGYDLQVFLRHLVTVPSSLQL